MGKLGCSDRVDITRVSDSFTLLYLLSKIPSKRGVGIVKIQKLAYLSSRMSIENGVKGFHYTFIKDRLGPFTGEIYNDLASLSNANLIDEQNNLTVAGKEQALRVAEHLNPIVKQAIDTVIQKFGKRSSFGIIADVHKITIEKDGKEIAIDELPRLTIVLDPNASDAKDIFWPEDILETFEIVLDSSLMKDLDMAVNDLKEGRIKPFS